MFDEIVCRVKQQARARVLLAADYSADLQRTATLIPASLLVVERCF